MTSISDGYRAHKEARKARKEQRNRQYAAFRRGRAASHDGIYWTDEMCDKLIDLLYEGREGRGDV